MRNTCFHYLYRDAANYKQHADVVVRGRVGFEDLKPFLESGEWFIPGDVGLPDLQHNFALQGCALPTADDHVWHELVSCEPADASPTMDMTAAELMQRFRDAARSGWRVSAAQTRLHTLADK